jgi:hypothetical protein
LLAALALAPTSAAAGAQVQIEAQITEVVRLDFDLGFKLNCDHLVNFDIENGALIQPYNTPPTTRKTSFDFMITGFGSTNITANFMGSGGNCVGSANDSIQLSINPVLKSEIKVFGSFAKGLSKNGKALKGLELGFVEAEFDDILEDFDDGLLSLNGAIAALFAEAAGSQAFVASALGGGLQSLSDLGSSSLQNAGAFVVPAAFSMGGKNSLWGNAQGATNECYADFVAELEALLCDALEALADLDDGGGLRTRVKLQALFPLRVTGPRLSDDYDDTIPIPAGWLGLLGWSGMNGSGVIGAGYGQSGATDAEIRVLGPGGRLGMLQLPFAPEMRQSLLLLVTPTIVSEPALTSLAAEELTPAAGNWRFELRYEADENPSDIIQITSP